MEFMGVIFSAAFSAKKIIVTPSEPLFFAGLKPIKKRVWHTGNVCGNNATIDMNESFIDLY